ncbi:MAG: GatB/YqeY domain-containing protein [Zetaproteobacteria bacterium]|nr:GatB/YqeY domain-containing protein [Zetaproteobacteria bacterium]
MVNKEQITDDMKAAMRAKDKLALGTIRMLMAAMKDKSIEVGHELDADEILAVITRMIKQRKDANAQYSDAGRNDLAEQEQAEIEVLAKYLPEALGDDEILALVNQAVVEVAATGMKDMGSVMGLVQKQLAGRADMAVVSGVVRSCLQAL